LASARPDTTGSNVLHVQQRTFPNILDPQKSVRTNEIAALELNYEGLTRLDKDLNTVPATAESWEFNADTTQPRSPSTSAWA
jgi:ABC-type oligopeptide transport system substrate-binding subunit